MAQPRRLGWMKTLLLTLLVLGAVGYGLWRYAHASGAVGLLEWADRTVGGNTGTAVAVSGFAYGTHAAQRLDVIVPNAPGPHPVLVFFHGGGWHSGRPEDYRFIGRTFARAGYVVVLPGYRLGPDGVFPRMLEDGAAALGWTAANIARHGGDPGRIHLMGHSAGAHTAVMLALDPQWLARHRLEPGLIRGVVGLSGPYDFHPFTSDSARNAFGHVTDPKVTQPIAVARGDAPPMLLLSGDADTTVRPRNSRALGTALIDAGAEAEVSILPGLDHAGTVLTLARPFDRDARVRQAALEFLAARQAASAPVQVPAS